MKNAVTSKIGLGTHLIKPNTQEVLSYGLSNGVVHIDTAPNYGEGKAHQIIAELLNCRKLQVEISTKVGFLGNQEAHLDSATLLRKNIPSDHIARNNILDPYYVLHKGKENFNELGNSKLDCLYLHNPEIHFDRLGRTALGSLITKCFESCEQLCDLNMYESYGIATWAKLSSSFTLTQLEKMAKDVGGSGHRFRCYQMPISLIRIESAVDAIKYGHGPLIEASDLDISIIASSPLHTGELPKIMSPELVRFFGIQEKNDNLWTEAQTAIYFVNSLPGVSRILVGCSSQRHVDELLQIIAISPMEHKDLVRIIDLMTETCQ